MSGFACFVGSASFLGLTSGPKALFFKPYQGVFTNIFIKFTKEIIVFNGLEGQTKIKLKRLLFIKCKIVLS